MRWPNSLTLRQGATRRVVQTALLGGCLLAGRPAAAVDVSNPDRAEKAYQAGMQAAERQDYAAALPRFAEASSLDPERRDYAMALTLARDRRISELLHEAAVARLANDPARADALLVEARTVDPNDDRVIAHMPAAVDEAARQAVARRVGRPLAGAVQVEPRIATPDFKLSGDVRSLVTQVAEAYGIRVVFDESVTAESLKFEVEHTPYTQAMPLLLRLSQLFATPVDPHTILVARDTQENRQRLERQVEETLFLPGSTQEQLNELVNIVKNVFDVTQVVVSPTASTLAIRAPQATVDAVNYVLADLTEGTADVVMDLRLLSVDKSRTRTTGIQPPGSVTAFSLAAEAQNLVAANQAAITQAIAQGAIVPTGNYATDIITEAAFLILSGIATDANLTNLVAIVGHGLTLTGISIGSSALANLNLTSSDSRALDDISVRIGDRQTTTLRIGSKYPITTATYSNGLSSAALAALSGRTINGVPVSSLLAQYATGTATTPLIQYEDLGLTLKATPTVLKSDHVTLQIDLKIEALTGVSSNDIPLLASRAFTSGITVQEGATVVLLSEMSSTEAASVNGLPGFGELPGLDQTLAAKARQVASSELVVLITPHVIRRRSSLLATRPIVLNSTILPDD